ncbi:hypothetical protein N9N28_08860 [Rubripirellula amarantea]|uniref:Uncharacterized protein n=1 Tax=Rubripirellula amarantea TaxID=2527999 RepID=A0A5C5WR39_9BACT|nr:hypothetical protein [Rubripirellula amarantea]MDA8744729.1 hypothetical protein [Rubripirellula amarantea]TWT52705.1 hypothetical protein Pla22_03310 [Rubripirellula amarantea]
MLTATFETNVAECTTVAQNETLPTDAEISRRVLAIRSGWTVGERVRRKREANERFVELLDALALSEAA